MAAKRFLIVSFFLAFSLFQCSAVRSFSRESEPEDLLLEEIASFVRRQNHPKQHISPEYRDDDLSNTEKKFAYRPDEPQFRKTWPPMAPPQTNRWSGAQDARSAAVGQKENIDFMHNAATSPGELVKDKHVPDSVVTEAPAKPLEKVKVESLDVNKNPAEAQPETLDDDGTDRIPEGPVAHAIISHERRGAREDNSLKDVYFTALVAGCTAAIVTITIGFGVCLYSWQKSRKMAQEVEYPAYGITGPGPLEQGRGGSVKKSGSGGSMRAASPKKAGHGDKKLAHSAHMFHFQHQKQQVIAMENSVERNGSNSGAESDDEDNEEGDYTVYECPGLAPTGEMEVKNPLFPDDPTPLDTSADPRRSSIR